MSISIISLKELFQKFIQKAFFNHVHKDMNFPLDIQADTGLSEREILESLYSASVLGGRCLCFLNKIGEIKKNRLLNGILVIVSFSVPEKITVPTIFCKSLKDIVKALEVSIELSDEIRLPVAIVISERLAGSFMEDADFRLGTQKSYSNLTKEHFKIMTENTLVDKLSVAEALLSNNFPQQKISGLLSFDKDGNFFKYLVPFSDLKGRIEPENIFVNESESGKLKVVFKQYGLPLFLVKDDEIVPDSYLRQNLCPGCPFVSVLENINHKNYEIFTDVDCKAVQKKFGICRLDVSEAYGIFISSVNKKYIFIGRYSNFRDKFLDKIPKESVVILKDVNRCGDFFKITGHPEKSGLPNYIFPYACENIIRYKPVKFKPAKCNCIEKGIEPLCIKITSCPALELSDNKVFLNSGLCTGCNACIKPCPTGALK